MSMLMSEAATAIDIYRQAARLNLEDPILHGKILEFPNYGQLVMTGDMHGHQRNFAKLQRFCDLENSPARHVVIHELIHEEPVMLISRDMSHLLLLEAAKWKCEFPDQVHFLQSNHELAQLTGNQISKGGRVVTRDFELGVERSYGDQSREVLEPMMELLASYPLLGRTANRVLLSHSLPGARTLSDFDPSELSQPTSMDDLASRGTIYAVVWGRHQTPEILDMMAKTLDVDIFICGHQPQEDGFDVVHDRMIILASDHNHGVFLPFDLSRSYVISELVRLIRPFAAIE